MKKYKIFVIFMLAIEIIVTLITNYAYINNTKINETREYRVESSRIAEDIKKSGYENLDIAKTTYNKLKSRIKALKNEENVELDKAKIYQNNFKETLENDLNTSNAITVLYDVLKSDLNDATKIYLINDFDKVLSLDLLKQDKIDAELESYIKNKIEERNQAKKDKNYALADEIRDELQSKSIIIKDTREGTNYEIKN